MDGVPSEIPDKTCVLIRYCTHHRSLFFAPPQSESTVESEQMSSSEFKFINTKGDDMATSERQVALTTGGIVLHKPRFYDFLAWAMMLGRERIFREKVLDLARLQSGETVLDVGCGTGTLAIAARRRVGSAGVVYGIDASPEMLRRAGQKARDAGLHIVFQNDAIEALSFPNASFDVVLSTLMFHHLPRKLREEGAREIRRVLKPGGRVIIVDFEGPARHGGLLSRIHRGHGHVSLAEINNVVSQAGLSVVESGAVDIRNLHFTLATTPCHIS
jgi:ubiquinone/menaquinone biosynthesis C-methylase UbiE